MLVVSDSHVFTVKFKSPSVFEQFSGPVLCFSVNLKVCQFMRPYAATSLSGLWIYTFFGYRTQSHVVFQTDK